MKLKTILALSILFTGVTVFAQSITVTGSITDAQTQESVPGATVLVKGTTNGVVADMDGKYSIEVSASDTLICSCFGYSDIEEVVGSRGVINFELKIDTYQLDETVVVGYGTLKKSQLVGSVESVSGDVLEDRVSSDITRSLQGQIPGLNIIQSDGKPTHGGAIYIRGGNTSYTARTNPTSTSKSEQTIGQGGAALVLIDGVEGDLSTVNPDDVESISVLKDASSAAIYGARAAYGVILVTTKDATKDRVSVTYNGSVSLNQRTVLWEDGIITDGLAYTETFYEFFQGYSKTPTYAGDLPTKINTYTIPSNYLEMFRERRAAGNTGKYDMNGSNYLYFGSENYLEMFYKRFNMTQTHNLSVSGSSDRVSYSITGRYYNQDGIYKIGNEAFNSYNLRSKIAVKANKWLSFDNNTSLYSMNYIQPIFSKGQDSVGSQLWQIEMQGTPVIPVYTEDGKYTAGAAMSGYASFNDGNSSQEERNLTVATTLGVNIEPIKDVLKFRGDFTYKTIRRTLERYTGPVEYYTAPGGEPTSYISQVDTYKRRYDYTTNYMSANAVLTWTPKLNENHNLNVVAGWNLENYDYERLGIHRTGLMYPGYTSLELFDGTDITLMEDGNSYGLVGFFARANYTLLNRYIFEVSARYDGSSKFPVNQQWGFFPSGSIGWRISEEPWMQSAKHWLNNLKLRANAGSLGNGTIAPYSFLETMSIAKSDVIFDGNPAYYVGVPSPVPDNLTWERVTTYDVGLDMDVLRNRLSLSADYYVRNTTNLFITGPELPAIYGVTPPKGNYGALQTRGWELTLSWKDSFKLAGKDFNYAIKGSLWDSRTWVTSYYNESGNIFTYYDGKELGEIWGFKTDGYFLSNEEAAAWYPDTYHWYAGQSSTPYAGDLRFLDTNDDGEIGIGSYTLEDHGDLERIGNESPRYQFGLNLDFRWNNIGLSMFFQGVGQRDWYPAINTGFFWGGYGRAYSHALKTQSGDNYVHIDTSTENWVVTNADENPYWTRRTYSVANSQRGALSFPNTHYLLNAAYVRLKNLTIDYTIPKHLLEKAKIQQLRIYLSGENLFTFSPLFKHTKMFDPEVIGTGDSDFHGATSTQGQGYSYPMLRTFTLGVSISF